MKDVHDVIKQAKFGDDRLRGSGVVAGQISAFPIDFAGRPYNTLTLPCERVISGIYTNFRRLLCKKCDIGYYVIGSSPLKGCEGNCRPGGN